MIANSVAEDTPFELVFYEEADGSEPVRDWAQGLTPTKRRAIGVAMHEILAHEGNDVISTEFGKALGGGLSEFRVRLDAEQILARRGREIVRKIVGRREKIMLRVFFHPHGDKLILLLAGYDKGAQPSAKRQQAEIEIARQRLANWRERQKS
jgi:phage-related protein